MYCQRIEYIESSPCTYRVDVRGKSSGSYGGKYNNNHNNSDLSTFCNANAYSFSDFDSRNMQNKIIDYNKVDDILRIEREKYNSFLSNNL